MNFNPDNINLKKNEDILTDDAALYRLFYKLEKKLSPYTPKPDDFRDVYGNKEVDLDLNLSDALEQKWKDDIVGKTEPFKEFQKREKLKAFIAEGIMVNQFSGNWLNVEGSNIKVYANRTARPDDYGVTNLNRKGFDLSLEFVNKNESSSDGYAGASIDITTSGKIETITNKVSKIIDIIKTGEAPIIKYFENEAETFKGSIKVAPFAFVLSDETIRDLFKKELYGKKEELESHTVQLSLLTQIKEQAEVFLSLSKKYHNHDLIDLYEKSLEHINYLFFKKRDQYKELNLSTENLYYRYKGSNIMNSVLIDLLKKEIEND